MEVQHIDTLDHSSVVRVVIPDFVPGSVIVKRSTGNDSALLTLREVRFYMHFAPLLSDGLCPKCYLSEEGQTESVLVLEDLEGPYSCCGAAPSQVQAQLFVLALAKLHTSARQIWNLSDLWCENFTDQPYNYIDGRLQSFPSKLSSFLSQHSKGLDGESVAILNDLPHLRELFIEINEDTIVHGDAHFWNALYSWNDARLIDWGNAALGFGEIDVAHAIAMNLPREVSREIEKQLLCDYAGYIAEDGRNHDVEEVWYRYKAGILYAITSSISMGEAGVPFETWWSLFINSMSAARELYAHEIL